MISNGIITIGTFVYIHYNDFLESFPSK